MRADLPPQPPFTTSHLQGLCPFPFTHGRGLGVGRGVVFQGNLSSASHCTCSYAKTWKPGVVSPSSSSWGGHPPVQAPVGAQPMRILPHYTFAQPTLTTPAFLTLAGSAANEHWILCSVAHKSCFSPSLLEERKWREPVFMCATQAAGLKGLDQ